MSVRMDAVFQGGLSCKATHEPSGDVLYTDAPKDNQGEGKHFSPTDLLGASLLTCMITTMAIAARGRGHTLGEVKGSVEKEMGTVPRRHVARLVVRLVLPAATPDDVREALCRAAEHCPVSSSLGEHCKIDLGMTYA